MKYHIPIILLSFLLFVGCKKGNETSVIEDVQTPIDISNWICQEINDTLHVKSFSMFMYRSGGIMNKSDCVFDKGNNYQAYMGCSYYEGHLTEVVSFGTEGRYTVSENEIKRDYKDIPLEREISIIHSKVYDLKNSKNIYKNREDSIFCLDNDSLVLYVIGR